MDKSSYLNLISAIIAWFEKDKVNHTFTIKSVNDPNRLMEIWIYNYEIKSGAFCDNYIPDLKAIKEEADRKEYKRLKATLGVE